MRRLLPASYIEALKNRDFFILSVIMFLFQTTSAFVLLALIVSVFSKTGSNFGVSGVVLSFVSPGLFLMAIAGLIADLFDRRKILVICNFLLAFVVILMILTLDKVYALISLSFLYFSVNSFFLPTASAASAQLVPKTKLLAANSIFIFTLAAGQIIGFFIAAVVHFFFGSLWTLVACFVITVFLVWLTLFLPPLLPRKKKASVLKSLQEIAGAFIYIFTRKSLLFYFLMFAMMQGIIAFGVTLGPGFFKDILGIGIEKSPLFILPLVGLGVYLGSTFVHNPENNRSYFVSLGLGTFGLYGLILGILIKLEMLSGPLLLLVVGGFLITLGFGVIVSMVTSRTVLQEKLSHNYQGSVFGASIVLGAFIASILSPSAAGLEALIGYIDLLIITSFAIVSGAILLLHLGNKWRF